MLNFFKKLDELLRGHRTSPDALLQGEIKLSLRAFVPMAVLLGATYGFFMGWYSIISRETPEYWQLLASIVKMPALFILTLIVTFPSLYVFNALVGCRLDFRGTLRLLVGAIVVNLAVAASLGPILAFFTVSTKSYAFMIVLNVLLLAIGGIVGLGFLLQTLRRLAMLGYHLARPVDSTDDQVTEKSINSNSDETGDHGQLPGPLDAALQDESSESYGKANSIFRVWVIIYSLVGVQMGWLLRPFIGDPDFEFQWFREREGNFFLGILGSLKELFQVGS
ncbi:MAG: hypothetical protein MI923_18865 [Phycisphaerales bacterium]|nr:hypothetical protein [Phycisphaerales bacterium]